MILLDQTFFARHWAFLLIFALIQTTTAVGGGLSAMQRAIDSISASELRDHVDRLADDTFEGRESGSRGGQAAAGYIVDRLRRLEIAPAGSNGSYFQVFDGGYRNILAYIEGADPQLKEEVIVVGAHYDHVGYGSQRNSYGPWGYIHNGADDNASGTSALLEIAEAFKKSSFQPKRSILLAFWDAEEKGLLGSTHWVNSPTLAFARVKCCFNADMIGRLTSDRLEVYGTRTANGFRQVVCEANREPQLNLDFTWTMKDDSDHWPFYQRNVPILMFHTGMHKEYHRPSDDAHLVNHAGMERITRLMFSTVVSLAMQDQLPAIRTQSRRETVDVQRSLEKPVGGPPPRLGLTWKKQSLDSGLHLTVSSVTYGSAAQRAGFMVGDVITQFNQAPITDDELFRRQILLAESPVVFQLQRGNSAPREIKLQLDGKPVQIGLTWREDAAEPAVVIVSHVVYGSAAHRAGLQAVDRIMTVNGQRFQNATEFSQLLNDSQLPLEIGYERRGKMHDVKLSADSPL